MNKSVQGVAVLCGDLSVMAQSVEEEGLFLADYDTDETPRPIVRTCKASRLWRLKNWFRKLRTGEHFVPFVAKASTRLRGVQVLVGTLRATVHKADGTVVDYGVLGRHLVVNAGKAFIVDAWQNLVELENMKFHGVGTGTTSPAAGDTALQTELTTQYNPDNTRATGSTTEASSMVFRTVGTNSFDASAAVTEWGLLSQAATGGGTLFDRQTFSAINVISGDSITTTYDLTVS